MTMSLQKCWSWLHNKITTKARNFLLDILVTGPIPKHVAFVMDGNRRYARVNHLAIQQGHSDGFVALRRILEICLRLQIHCVSVYAFSIENFKRSEEEVSALMKLAEEKLLELCQHGDLLDEYGVRLNVVGRKELLPTRVQNAVAKAENMTRHNKCAVLNLCMPYTSRDEITTAVESCIRSTQDLPDKEISEHDIDSHLMTSLVGSPPLDILVRTSGVKRLSDFMLWQTISPCGFAMIHCHFQRQVFSAPGELTPFFEDPPILWFWPGRQVNSSSTPSSGGNAINWTTFIGLECTGSSPLATTSLEWHSARDPITSGSLEFTAATTVTKFFFGSLRKKPRPVGPESLEDLLSQELRAGQLIVLYEWI